MMNDEIYKIYAMAGLIFVFGSCFFGQVLYDAIQEKKEKEREKKREKKREELEKKQKLKVLKKRDFFLKTFSKNYDYLYLGNSLRNYHEQDKILCLFGAHDAFHDNIDKEFHLISIPSRRNKEGICVELHFVMILQKKHKQKKYFKAIEKILCKELLLNLALVKEIEPFPQWNKFRVKGTKSFKYKGYSFCKNDNCLHLVEEIGHIKTFENLWHVYENLF